MNRKLISILTVIALLSLAFIGCAAPNDTTEPEETNGQVGETEIDEQFEIRIATVVTEPHPWVDMANHFRDELSARSNGNINVTIYQSGQLGSDEDTIEDLREGILDIVIGATTNAAPFVPEVQVFGISYLFENMDHFKRTIEPDGEVFNRIQELYEERNLNLRLLALSGGGTRNLSHANYPIETPDDLAGDSMRVTASPIEGQIWAELGALPVSLPWGDIYSAVQTGVADAFESTISGYFGSSLYEVAPYMAKTEHLYMLSHITISEHTWNALPEQYRELIAEVAIEAGYLGTDMGEQYDEELLEEMIENHGVQANEVDKEAFISRVEPLHTEIAQDIGAEDFLQMIRDTQ